MKLSNNIVDFLFESPAKPCSSKKQDLYFFFKTAKRLQFCCHVRVMQTALQQLVKSDAIYSLWSSKHYAHLSWSQYQCGRHGRSLIHPERWPDQAECKLTQSDNAMKKRDSITLSVFCRITHLELLPNQYASCLCYLNDLFSYTEGQKALLVCLIAFVCHFIYPK